MTKKQTKPTTPKESEVSFVKIENANMLKLTLKQLAKLYTNYAKIVLDVKEIKDKKVALRKELFDKMADFDSSFKEAVKLMPKHTKKIQPAVTMKKPLYPETKTPTVEYEYGDSFSNLRKEFETIRQELEKIR